MPHFSRHPSPRASASSPCRGMPLLPARSPRERSRQSGSGVPPLCHDHVRRRIPAPNPLQQRLHRAPPSIHGMPLKRYPAGASDSKPTHLAPCQTRPANRSDRACIGLSLDPDKTDQTPTLTHAWKAQNSAIDSRKPLGTVEPMIPPSRNRPTLLRAHCARING